MARDSVNTSAIIIAVKTLGALEGFLPKARMLAKLLAANTAHGAKIPTLNIIRSARFLLIPSPQLSKPYSDQPSLPLFLYLEVYHQ